MTASRAATTAGTGARPNPMPPWCIAPLRPPTTPLVVPFTDEQAEVREMESPA